MRTLWPRLRAAWMTLTGTGAAASVAFGLLVFASVLASLAIPRESAGLRNEALQRVIATSQPGDRTVTGTTPETTISDGYLPVPASEIAVVGAAFQARLAAAGVPVASEPPAWEGLTTGFVPVSGAAAQAAGYRQPQVEIAYRSALDRYSQLVAGQLPAGGTVAGHTTTLQVAVTTTAAARFGLRVGSRLTAGPVQLVVTGIIRPLNTATPFWTQDPVVARPAPLAGEPGQLPYWIGAVFIGPGGLPLVEDTLDPGQMRVTWEYAATLGGLTANQANGVEAKAASLVANGATVNAPGLVSPATVTVYSQIPSILSPFVTGENAAAPVLELLYVGLAVLGAVVVLLGAQLVAQRRAAEFTLMRARGAALWQLAWLVLRVNVIIAAVAGAAAAALAIGLTSGLDAPVGWWLAGFTIAVTLVGPVLISVVPRRVAARATERPGRPVGRRHRAARRIVIEVALVALSVGGLVVLRNEGPPSGSNGLYASAAPVLIAIPVAVIVLRCYPPLARQLARLAGLSRGVVGFVGLARATRTPPGTIVPSFALVLVLAMVAFPDMITTSVNNSQVAASWQQVGADAIIQAPSGETISPALQRQISAVPGVSSTAPGVVESASLPTGFEVSVLFVDPPAYAAVVDETPGPPFPLAALSGSGQASATYPAVATGAAAQLPSAGPTTINIGTGTLTIQVTGRVGSVPGATGLAGGALVVPLQALGPNPPEPDLLLVAGPGLDAARLTAVVRSALPGAVVTARSTALAALTTAPVLQAAQTALSQGLAAAAGFGVLVLLLSLLLNARSRELTLASLATMGLRRWQAQLLLATETLPPVVAAAVGGVACAWLLAPLVGPTLNLAAYSGTGSAIVVTPAPFPLLASAAALVIVALLVMAAQAAITYYRGSARALRIAD